MCAFRPNAPNEDSSHFQYVREVSRPPGVTLIETLRGDGLRCLTQAVALRPLFLSRRTSEDLLRKASQALRKDITLVHQSVFVRADGGQTFLWTTPWPHSGRRLSELSWSPEAVASLGEILVPWMTERHRAGIYHPTLSVDTLLLHRQGVVQAFGVPVALAKSAYDSITDPAYQAPGEYGRAPTPTGDYQRLEHSLRLLIGHAKASARRQEMVDALDRFTARLPLEPARAARELAESCAELAPARRPWRMHVQETKKRPGAHGPGLRTSPGGPSPSSIDARIRTGLLTRTTPRPEGSAGGRREPVTTLGRSPGTARPPTGLRL
ncbi:MAG: hypothetical protein AAFZ18_02270 [Myxococcota bacterium]